MSGGFQRKDGGRQHLLLPLLLLGVSMAGGLTAAAFPSREEVLSRVYPEATISAERVFLSESQAQQVSRLSGVETSTRLIARYRATRSGVEVGRAYVDTHVVRTKKESLLICLDAQGGVERVEVTAFLEPPEYVATHAWYRQFGQRQLSDDLVLDRAIRPVAGATLTALATTRAVRRVLAIDRVLQGAVP